MSISSFNADFYLGKTNFHHHHHESSDVDNLNNYFKPKSKVFDLLNTCRFLQGSLVPITDVPHSSGDPDLARCRNNPYLYARKGFLLKFLEKTSSKINPVATWFLQEEIERGLRRDGEILNAIEKLSSIT